MKDNKKTQFYISLAEIALAVAYMWGFKSAGFMLVLFTIIVSCCGLFAVFVMFMCVTTTPMPIPTLPKKDFHEHLLYYVSSGSVFAALYLGGNTITLVLFSILLITSFMWRTMCRLANAK